MITSTPLIAFISNLHSLLLDLLILLLPSLPSPRSPFISMLTLIPLLGILLLFPLVSFSYTLISFLPASNVMLLLLFKGRLKG